MGSRLALMKEAITPTTTTVIRTGSTFFQYVETAAAHGIINGYPCGAAPADVCVPPDNKPYFLPNADATRAQISKIVYLAATSSTRK